MLTATHIACPDRLHMLEIACMCLAAFGAVILFSANVIVALIAGEVSTFIGLGMWFAALLAVFMYASVRASWQLAAYEKFCDKTPDWVFRSMHIATGCGVVSAMASLAMLLAGILTA